MTLSITAGRADLAALDVPLLAVAMAAGDARDDRLAALDVALGGALARFLDRRDFRAGRDETLHLGGGSGGPPSTRQPGEKTRASVSPCGVSAAENSRGRSRTGSPRPSQTPLEPSFTCGPV